MFDVSKIGINACIAPSDHVLAGSLKYTWILSDIRSSTDESCNRIHIGIHKCCVHGTILCTPNQRCLNQESMVVVEPVHHGQSISDKTLDSNVHEHIYPNKKVPNHVQTTYVVCMLWHSVK